MSGHRTPAPTPYTDWDRGSIRVLAVLFVLNELGALGWTLVIPALPRMAAELHTTQIAWVVTAYSLAGAVVAPVAGRIADLFGKRLAMVGCCALTAVGSVVAAAASTLPVTVLGRGLQGFGIALVPLSYALARDVFSQRLATMAISITTTGLGLVTILSYFVSGALLDRYGYRSLFWLLGALAGLLVLLLGLVVPESPARSSGRVDWAGAVLLGGGCALLLLWLSESGQHGWISPGPIGIAGIGTVVLGCWLAQASRSAAPLVDPTVLLSRAWRATLSAGFLAQGAIAAAATLLPMLVMTPVGAGLGYGFGSSTWGLTRYQVPAGVAAIAGGYVVGRVSRRWPPSLLFGLGTAGLVGGCASLAARHADPTQVVLGAAVVGLGSGVCFAALPNLIVALAEPARVGSLAGAAGSVQAIGAAAGVQLVFTVLATGAVTSSGRLQYAEPALVAGYLVCAGLAGLAGTSAVAAYRGERPRVRVVGAGPPGV